MHWFPSDCVVTTIFIIKIILILSFNEIYFKTLKIVCIGLYGAGKMSQDAGRVSNGAGMC